METRERWPGVGNRLAYDALAPFYDRHWGRRFFWSSTELFLDLLAHRVDPGSHILDLCCGTGDFANWLDRQGMYVTGADNSERMLACARTNVPRASFYTADMREFDLGEQFDAVTCMYNSINQALTTRSLRSMLRCVDRHLRRGGWFLFDFVEEEGYAESWEADEVLRLDDKVYELRYRYDSTRGSALCLVSIQGDGPRGPKVEFELRQRPLEILELRRELSRSGFSVVAACPVRNAVPTKGRSAVLARAGSDRAAISLRTGQAIDCLLPGFEHVATAAAI